jgi:hypothetical protein
LVPLYVTDARDTLEFIDGEEAYHIYHKKYHVTYRDHLVSRNYEDLFMFDTKGNMIYSVFKATDVFTNFGTKKSQDLKYVEWQNSGVGDAYRAALATPGVIAEVPWAPYGPAAGATASFMALAVRDEEDASTIGVFCGRLPPVAMSVEDVEVLCTQDAIASSFEGAINFVGLGQPLQANLGVQVPCFSGRTAEAFLKLLDQHVAEGYPLGDESTQVSQPFDEVKAHAADATCVFAYAVKHLLAEPLSFSMADIKGNTEAVYSEFISFIKTTVDFQGASGRITFSGNDKAAYLGVVQIQDGAKKLVGTCSHNGTTDLTVNGGPSNASWQPAHPDAPPPEENFPYFVFQVFLPLLCICCPALGACIRSW